MRIYRSLGIALGLLLLVAAAGKVLDPRSTADSISYIFTGAVRDSGPMLALSLVVAFIEVLLGSLLVLVKPGVRLLGCLLGLLIVFSAALVRLAFGDGAPDCGCFGLTQFLGEQASSAQSGLIRNALLASVVVWMILFARRQRPMAPRSTTIAVRAPNAGFTLIELSVVLAVVSVLFSLSLPAMLGSRMRAEMTRSLSTQRQILASVSLYARDHAETLPHFGIGDRTGRGTISVNGELFGVDYFQSHLFNWAALIYPHYFDNLMALEPGDLDPVGVFNRSGRVHSGYKMTYNAWADPKFWNDGYPRPVGRLLRSTRIDEVWFPSQKGLLLDMRHGAVNQREFPGYRNLSIGRADGSASELDWWSVQESAVYDNPDWPMWWPWPVLATRDGLAGRDFGIRATQEP